MRHWCTLTALILGLGGAAAAGAQGMTDPTRPPGGMAATAGDEAVSAGPVLQSVMLSPGRKIAMISGEIVVLGGRYGSARLVKLTESEAVLKNGPETTVLRLFPLVEKRMAGSAKNSAGKTTK